MQNSSQDPKGGGLYCPGWGGVGTTQHFNRGCVPIIMIEELLKKYADIRL